MRFPFDRRVWPGTFFLSAAILLLYFWTRQAWILLAGAGILFAHFLFFRDPERKSGAQPSGVFSPADGVVTSVDTVFEGRYIQDECLRIRIFLSIFDVHVNRSPVGGILEYVEYVPGRFYNALHKKSYEYNESNWLGVRCHETCKILFRQIAGAIARRICCDVKTGKVLEQGSRIGVICYGSGMEVYAPKRMFRPAVKAGQKVRGGETLLGTLSAPF